MLPPALTADHGGGHVKRAAIQPSAQHDLRGKLPCKPGQIGKSDLRDVLRAMGVVVHQSHGGRINQVDVPRHQLGKSPLQPVRHLLGHQSAAILHFPSKAPADHKSDNKNALCRPLGHLVLGTLPSALRPLRPMPKRHRTKCRGQGAEDKVGRRSI